MGLRISKDGLSIDPNKVSSMRGMEEPRFLETLRRFLGMVNYLAKFLPNITRLMNPLLNLLKKDVRWNWSSSQQKSFDSMKEAITTAPVLAYYDPGKPLTLQNDACEYSIGSALFQVGKPIPFASRSECRYAQIEKEMLASRMGWISFTTTPLGDRFLPSPTTNHWWPSQINHCPKLRSDFRPFSREHNDTHSSCVGVQGLRFP